jgi:hypothetical protein
MYVTAGLAASTFSITRRMPSVLTISRSGGATGRAPEPMGFMRGTTGAAGKHIHTSAGNNSQQQPAASTNNSQHKTAEAAGGGKASCTWGH